MTKYTEIVDVMVPDYCEDAYYASRERLRKAMSY